MPDSASDREALFEERASARASGLYAITGVFDDLAGKSPGAIAQKQRAIAG